MRSNASFDYNAHAPRSAADSVVTVGGQARECVSLGALSVPSAGEGQVLLRAVIAKSTHSGVAAELTVMTARSQTEGQSRTRAYS